MYFTPAYSSWINQVERFFGFVTADLLRRSDHRSVQALEADLRAWGHRLEREPNTLTWTKSAEQILESLGRLLNRISGAGL
jgi:transposase